MRRPATKDSACCCAREGGAANPAQITASAASRAIDAFLIVCPLKIKSFSRQVASVFFRQIFQPVERADSFSLRPRKTYRAALRAASGLLRFPLSLTHALLPALSPVQAGKIIHSARNPARDPQQTA